MTSNLEGSFCFPKQASPKSFDGKLASKSASRFTTSKPQEAAAVFSRACLEEMKLVKSDRDSTFFNALHKKSLLYSTCSFVPLQYYLFLTSSFCFSK